MKKHLLWIVGAFTVSIWAACNCGHSGVPCTSVSDCPTGELCVSGYCSNVFDDGGPGPDGGPPGDGGPDGGDGGCVNLECQQVACPGGGSTTLTGKVYDPSGQVPLYNAIVYVPNGQTQPFTPGVICDRCGAVTSGSPLVSTLTGPDGAFTLTNVPTGSNIPLVIQIGRWRRQVTLPSVPACSTTPITDVNLVRFPRNKSEGDIPLMAIATGNADPFECLLRKMGISDSEFTVPGGAGRVHYYHQNGIDMPPPGAPAGNTLWSDAGTLMNYDVVLLPCEGMEDHNIPASAKQNIIDYTSAGGRVFTTHYGYVWIAGGPNFPPAPDPFPTTGDWRPDPNQTDNPPDPFTVTVDQSFPKGSAFAQWLVNVDAGTTLGSLDLHETRHDLWGADAGSTRWLYGTVRGNPSVQHMTFNTPVNPPGQADGGSGLQCGRLVFSDFHVTTAALTGQQYFPASCRNAPMTPQEKALVFMLFDVSSCIQRDQAPPTICAGVRQSCSTGNPCCTGLVCKAPSGQVCGGSDTGCRCGAVLG
jgi:hypothetical protein